MRIISLHNSAGNHDTFLVHPLAGPGGVSWLGFPSMITPEIWKRWLGCVVMPCVVNPAIS